MMTKKIYVDEFVCLLFISTEAPITASSENVPDSQSSLIGENIIIFSHKKF